MANTKKATFAGVKSLGVIRMQCKTQGVELDVSKYLRGSNHVTLRSPGACVVFNTINGRFIGNTPDGITFTSDDKRDGTPWFDALLRFFYIEKRA